MIFEPDGINIFTQSCPRCVLIAHEIDADVDTIEDMPVASVSAVINGQQMTGWVAMCLGCNMVVPLQADR